MANQLRVEELNPEPDQRILLNVARLKDAVELKVGIPVDFRELVRNVHAYGCEKALANVGEGTG